MNVSRALRILLLAATLSAGSFAQQPPPETVLLNGKVVTVNARFGVAEAVAIAQGRFTAVGSSQEIRKLAGASTNVIDLGGRTVVPGLADNHLHNAGGGPGLDLSRTRSVQEVLDAIAARAKVAGPDEVIVTNSDWHEAQLKEQRLPLRRDLDKAAPDRAVVLVRGGHQIVLNSVALRRWKIDEKTPVPEGGRISRYPDGSLDGQLVDTARAYAKLPPPAAKTLEQRVQDQVAEYKTLHAAGLTSIRHPGTSVEQYRLIEELRRRGLLTMRVSVLLRPDRTSDVASLRTAVEGWKLRPDDGDEWLRIGGIKLGVDGGFEGGLMREPYLEPYGEGGTYRGLQTMPTGAYTEIVRELNRLGWRVHTHAVGDRAIDLVLDAYEAANREKSIVGRRWAIEHGFIPTADQFPRMKRLDLHISAQNHLYLAGPSLVRYWGPARAGWTTPVRAYLDQGLVVSAGTDAAVVPYPPLWVIYHFVTRDTISGGVLGPDQKITRQEALRLSTINNAHLTFEEGIKGSIEPGKLADLVVLSDDILTCPEERIEQMTVLLTMVGGKVVFEHRDFRGTR
jgi:predicted amidohydrolase YtcJ